MSENTDKDPLSKVADDVHSEWAKKFQTFRAFWRTKRAIAAGTPLYDWPLANVQAAGYLGPWKFNAIGIAITGGVASVTTNFLNFLAGAKPDEPQKLTDVASLLADADPALASPLAFNSLLTTTSGWVYPFAIPMFLTSVVYLISWGTLRSKDSNPQSRHRARSAYLYFDGAYGFVSQLFLAFGVSLLFTKLGQKVLNIDELNPFGLAFLVAVVLAVVWQFVISLNKIPQLMFVANGYSRARHFWQRAQPNGPPRRKFFLAHILGGWPLVVAINLLLAAISYLLATLLFWLRSLIL